MIQTIVGGLVALAGGVIVKVMEYRQQRNALRAAFGSEIAGLLKIAAIRKHEETGKFLVGKWKEGDFDDWFFVGKPPDQDPVYRGNVDKIGLLGNDAEDVAMFYTMLAAIRVHQQALVDGTVRDMKTRDRIFFVQQALELWAVTRPLGEDLAKRLLPKRPRVDTLASPDEKDKPA